MYFLVTNSQSKSYKTKKQTYILINNNYRPIMHLPLPDKPSLIVRCNPTLFKLRPESVFKEVRPISTEFKRLFLLRTCSVAFNCRTEWSTPLRRKMACLFTTLNTPMLSSYRIRFTTPLSLTCPGQRTDTPSAFHRRMAIARSWLLITRISANHCRLKVRW